eukprot:3444652-Karenia_brevis.AAC.1
MSPPLQMQQKRLKIHSWLWQERMLCSQIPEKHNPSIDTSPRGSFLYPGFSLSRYRLYLKLQLLQ